MVKMKKPEEPKCMLNQDHGLYSNQWRPKGTPVIPIFCKKFLFHSWVSVSTYPVRVHTYQTCSKCGRKRIITNGRSGYQPILSGWGDEVQIYK